MPTLSVVSTATSLVVINADVPDYSILVNSLRPNANVLVLDAHQDGIAQITARLRQCKQVHSLHIISHGAPGRLHLGSCELSLESIDRYTSQLKYWGVASIEPI